MTDSLRHRTARALRRIPPAWRTALVAFLAVRVMASGVAAVALTTVPANPIVPAAGYFKPDYPPSMEILLGVWERSDALWYLRLAQHGYTLQGAAFMPLYPGSIRVLTAVGLPPLAAALLLSNGAFLLALYFLYRLGEIDLDRKAAERAVWYQALFPGSVFLLAPYTESLYLCLATGAFLAARTQRWALAGLAGAFLSATRTVGVTALLPLALLFLQDRRKPWPQALFLLLVPLGLGGVALYDARVLGDPLAFVHSQAAWARQPAWPWSTFAEGFSQARTFVMAGSGGIYLLEAAAALFAAVLAALAPGRLPWGYAAFAWIGLLVPLTVPYGGNVLVSMPRFVAVLFPCFLTLAALVRSREADGFTRAVLAGLSGLCVALYVASRTFF